MTDAVWVEDHFDNLIVPMEAQDLIDSYQGQAGLLGRAILMGLAEPDMYIAPEVMLVLADNLVEEIQGMDIDDMRFPSRITRALKWAVRDDVMPEAAIKFYASISIKVTAAAHNQAEAGDDETVAAVETAFFEKYGHLLT